MSNFINIANNIYIQYLRRDNMENKKQTINCKVGSCEYQTENRCLLSQITVEPYNDIDTGKKDETLCGSYKAGN